MKSFKDFLKKRRIAKANAEKAKILAKKKPESYWATGPGRRDQSPSNTSSGDMWINQTWNNQ